MADEPQPESGVTQRLRKVLGDDLHLTSLGFGFTAILLTAMAAATWWAGRTQDASLHQAHTERVRAVGSTLARSTEVLLAHGQLNRTRRLVVETAHEANLSRCRLLLPSGQVLADAQPEAITQTDLPTTWDGDAPPPRPDTNSLCRTFTVTVPDRGTLLLEVAAEADPAADLFWQTRAGIGAVCVLALVILVLMHRRFRKTFRGIWAVRRALMAHLAGQVAPEALKVHADWGAEAEAWNGLMDQMEKTKRRTTLAQTEESLRLQRGAPNDLSAACDALSQGLILVDGHCRARYLNSAAAVLLQVAREEADEADIAEILPEEQVVEAVRQSTRRPMQRRQIFEIERTGAAGRVLLRFIVRPVRREDSAVAMIVIEDITQQRVAQDARNAFLAQATHELRTPLTNIRACAEMGLDDGKDDPAVQANCLSTITQEACRLERIVGDILSASEIEAGALRLNVDDVRVDDLMASLEADYAAQAQGKGITLTFDLPPKLPVLRGDREKIALGFHNLIGNALKYTLEGGSVTVRADVEDEHLVAQVIDTGIGMTEEDCERVFEKFYRSPDRRVTQITGSGLGLGIAREVIRLHGGEIAVESEPDQGSTFTLTLPVAEGVAVA